jgi:hypothetical protein
MRVVVGGLSWFTKATLPVIGYRDEAQRRRIGAGCCYRRIQTTEADCRREKFGSETLALDEYVALLGRHKLALLSLARRAGATEQEAETTVAEFMARVISVPVSDFDEVGVQMILIELVRVVERACAELNLPVRDGIVYGTARSPGVTAQQKPVLGTGASIVEIGAPFIILCDLLSKLLAHTICTEEADQIKFAMAPDNIRSRLRSQRWLVREWRRLLLHYAVRDRPPPSLGRAPVGTILDIRRGLLDGMEVFIIAHEYSHHLLEHSINEASVQPTSLIQGEYDADTLAHIISIQVVPKGSLPSLLFVPSVCAVAILAFLDVIARAREVLRTGTDELPHRQDHPSAKQRLDALNHYDEEHDPAAAEAAANLRQILFDVIEEVWNELRPDFERLRRHGVRAQHQQGTGPLDWLPFAYPLCRNRSLWRARVSRLRHIETASRQAALIQSMIDDLERRVQILRVDICTEEERLRVFDRADPLYPMMARTLSVRLENIGVTIADLKNRLTSFDPDNEVRKAA